MARVILASSNQIERRSLRDALAFEGYTVTQAVNLADAEEKTRSYGSDLLIVDSELEGGDVFCLCRAIRLESNLGIIVILDSDSRQSGTDALNAGADDYLAGSFSLDELCARVRAILRRLCNRQTPPNYILLEDRTIDLRSRKVQGPGSSITNLTPKEFIVLTRLIEGEGKVVTNYQLGHILWSRDGQGTQDYVRVVVGQLRRKLERNHNSPRHIITERAIGYRFITLSSAEAVHPRETGQTLYRIDNPAMAL